MNSTFITQTRSYYPIFFKGLLSLALLFSGTLRLAAQDSEEEKLYTLSLFEVDESEKPPPLRLRR